LFQYAKALDLSHQFYSVGLVDQTQSHSTQRPFYLEEFLDASYSTIYKSQLSWSQNFRLQLARKLQHFDPRAIRNLVRILGINLEDISNQNDIHPSFFKTIIFEGNWLDVKTVDRYQTFLIEKIQNICNSKVSPTYETSNRHIKNVIHLRGTDFLLEKNQRSLGLLDKAYYTNALARYGVNTQKVIFCVVTDDKEYAERFFASTSPSYILGPEDANEWESFYILINAEVLIIGNSTFAWWAGYICAQRGGKVVMPDTWNKVKTKHSLKLPKAILISGVWK